MEEERRSKRKHETTTREHEQRESTSDYKPTKKMKLTNATAKDDQMPIHLCARTSPNPLYMAIRLLSPSQKQCVRDMGFESLLNINLESIPEKIGHYVVTHFDCKEKVIKTENGRIAITKEEVHKVLGLPIGGINLMTLRPIKRAGVEERWMTQYQKARVRPNHIVDQIRSSIDADFNFKMNFVVLFANTMGCRQSNGDCYLNLLGLLDEETVFSDIDWCGYIVDCLTMMPKYRWKLGNPNGNHYAGPLTALVLIYVDKVNCEAFPMPRQIPAIKCWSTVRLKQREKAEIESGGFGIGEIREEMVQDENQAREVPMMGERQLPPTTSNQQATLEACVDKLGKMLSLFLKTKTFFKEAIQLTKEMFPEAYEIKDLEKKFFDSFHQTSQEDEQQEECRNVEEMVSDWIFAMQGDKIQKGEGSSRQDVAGPSTHSLGAPGAEPSLSSLQHQEETINEPEEMVEVANEPEHTSTKELGPTVEKTIMIEEERSDFLHMDRDARYILPTPEETQRQIEVEEDERIANPVNPLSITILKQIFTFF